ncbi:penicillin-binding protein 2 [Rothia kristinae]|uniref:Penicillin-binding protein 2 n=1 Tax=Rothia kristinae TaxID=37923 RepID=A0A7T4T3L8_9MICC|nr:penicillin-binding protein 2 [Rothia kristinae]QQC58727.1 penicillin-binding protein 2 [Rothia kristinae]
MNQAIRRTWLAVAGVFVLLLGSLTYVQFFDADSLEASAWNSRRLYDEYGSARGPILVGGQEIASSQPSQDGFNYQRVYADSETYSDVTGYFSLVYGATGIEQAMDQELSGDSDSQFYDRISRIFSGQQARGASVELTLDAKLQELSMQLLQGHRGAIVAMEPKTGKILAMASSPSYDANALSSHDSKSTIAAYNELNGNPDKPLANRAIGGDLYAPGSTFKIIDAAAALESGEYDKDSVIPNPQNLTLPDSTTTLPNYVNGQCHTRSEATIEWALAQSCNVPFAQIGMKLGQQRMQEAAEKFGYGQRLGIPQEVTSSTFPQDMNGSQLAMASIGQYDVRTTPLQVAMMSSAIANDGVQMKPTLVSKVRSSSLSTLYDFKAQQLRRPTTTPVARQIKEWMVNDVDDGIASGAKVPGVEVAGKTGTAETGQDGLNDAWFTGFAPADDPQVAVAIVYEDVDATTGAQLTSPGAQKIFEAVLDK